MRAVKYVQVRHDDGRWYEAELLDQHRSGDRWRAVVRYTVVPGMRYVRGMWADELRPVIAHKCGDHISLLKYPSPLASRSSPSPRQRANTAPT